MIVTLAAIDAVRDDAASGPEPFKQVQATTRPTRTEDSPGTSTDDRPITACAKKQIVLWAGNLGGSPVIELSNPSDQACRTPRLPIRIRFFDEGAVKEVAATASVHQAFASTTLSPGVDLTVGFNVIDQCGGRKPKTYVVEVGPYVTGARVPKGSVYSCIDDVG